jgi:hypothetical protein
MESEILFLKLRTVVIGLHEIIKSHDPMLNFSILVVFPSFKISEPLILTVFSCKFRRSSYINGIFLKLSVSKISGLEQKKN